MRRPILRLLTAVALAVVPALGCQSAPPPIPPAPVDAATPAPDVATPAPDAPTGPAVTDGATAEVHTGRLVFDPIPPTKSVRAYMGDELRLEGDGEPLVLTASEAVSRDALIAAHGKTVTVRAVRHAPVRPRPDESYPVDMNGEPLARPALWQVLSLEVRGD